METLHIEFFEQEQLIDFCNWFKAEGFAAFMASKFNGQNSSEISCLATFEVPSHEDTETYDTTPYIELQ